jgi:hypothetical protein
MRNIKNYEGWTKYLLVAGAHIRLSKQLFRHNGVERFLVSLRCICFHYRDTCSTIDIYQNPCDTHRYLSKYMYNISYEIIYYFFIACRANTVAAVNIDLCNGEVWCSL